MIFEFLNTNIQANKINCVDNKLLKYKNVLDNKIDCIYVFIFLIIKFSFYDAIIVGCSL